jgi:BlaI family transcriptional regulator, penicillinase repressor
VIPNNGMKKSFPLLPPSSTALGPLEQKMLEEVWARRSATVRELLADGNIRQAYTTIMTTLDRLFKKGLLDRVAEGKAFRYSPRCTREELPQLVALSGMRRWMELTEAPALPLSYFVEAISARDARLLDELRELVERKRRELKQGKQR